MPVYKLNQNAEYHNLTTSKTKTNIVAFEGKNLVTSNIRKISCFCTDGKISVRINLPLFSTVVPAIIFVFLSGQKHKYNSWDDGGK